jgi:hypothetical protein
MDRGGPRPGRKHDDTSQVDLTRDSRDTEIERQE